MKTRVVSFVIACILMLNIFPFTPVLAASVIISDFEDNVSQWTGIDLYSDDASGGTGCGIASSVLHSTASSAMFSAIYNGSVSVTKGKTYSVQFFVKSLSSNLLTTPESYIYSSPGSGNIVANVSKIGSQWQRVSAMFYAEESGEFSLTFMFFAYSELEEILIDDIIITEQTKMLSSMRIEGRKKACIPLYGSEEYTYSSYAVDTDGNKISLLSGTIEPDDFLPDGVTFSTDSGVLSVNSTAVPNTTITLKSIPPQGFEGIPIEPFVITLDRNLIQNGTFEETVVSVPWENANSYYIYTDKSGNNALSLSTVHSGTLFNTGISLNDTLYLQGGALYVFRAKVRLEKDFPTRQVSSYMSVDYNNFEINISLSDIGSSSWNNVLVSTYIETDGMYNLNLFCSAVGNSNIIIDDICLQEENVAVSSILFSAPAHISAPEKGKLSLRFDYAIGDQMGNVLSGETASFSVEPATDGVIVKNNYIIVTSTVSDNVYKITATSDSDPTVKHTHLLTVNHENIGDGSFEAYPAGHWWATTKPSALELVSEYGSFLPSSGQKFAVLEMNGSVSALFSDSHKKYFAGESYVFTADIKKAIPDIPTIATAIIYNSDETDFENNLFAAQFELDNTSPIQYVFMPNFDITGRMIIAFNTPDDITEQTIILDDVKIEPATTDAQNVNLVGLPYPDKYLSGNYRFYANFNTSDISTFRWLISPTENGVYTPLISQTAQSLSVTPEMVGQYIKFEVTPISLDGPVVGKSVTSAPVKIREYTEGEAFEEIIVPETEEPLPPTPQIPDTPLAPTEQEPLKTKGEITVSNIYNSNFNFYRQSFVDTQNHWAKENIDILTSAGIVNGVGEALFLPDKYVTRAEFSTFLIRAFGLAPQLYTETFADVHRHQWFSGAVETSTKYGFTTGVGNGLFMPETFITREQMISMIMRAYKKSGSTMPETLKDLSITFVDSGNLSNWAKYDSAAAYTLNILSGIDGKINPSSPATRAEAVTLIKRMIDVILKDLSV